MSDEKPMGQVIQIDEAEPAMASLVRTALAKRIIEMAHRPGVDVEKLRDDAIAPPIPSPRRIRFRLCGWQR